MKKYQSHKIVQAAEIEGIFSCTGGFEVIVKSHPGNSETYHVNEQFFSRWKASTGDYLVVYEDGYMSWSPKTVFEEGYTEIDSSVDIGTNEDPLIKTANEDAREFLEKESILNNKS